MNGFVRRLVLKPRQKAARKRPVAILYWMPRSHVRILIYQTLPFQKEVVLTNTFCAVLSSPVTSSYIGLGNSLTPSSLLVYDKARQHITLQNQFICLWYLVYTVDCIYLWTLPLKACFQLTSNVYVLGVKLWNFATYQWFSQVFLIFSRLRWQWTTRALTMSRELRVWAEKTQSLTPEIETFEITQARVWAGKLQSLTPET